MNDLFLRYGDFTTSVALAPQLLFFFLSPRKMQMMNSAPDPADVCMLPIP